MNEETRAEVQHMIAEAITTERQAFLADIQAEAQKWHDRFQSPGDAMSDEDSFVVRGLALSGYKILSALAERVSKRGNEEG